MTVFHCGDSSVPFATNRCCLQSIRHHPVVRWSWWRYLLAWSLGI